MNRRVSTALTAFSFIWQILYQEENPGIEFEYSLKKDAVKQTPSGKTGGYQWTQVSLLKQHDGNQIFFCAKAAISPLL
jgi:hypothetical protein